MTERPAEMSGRISIGEGIEVPRMAYGAMRLAGDGAWGDAPDRDAAIDVLNTARSLGVELIDTAWAYGPETNEALIADALHPYGNMRIATKCGLDRSGPGQWTPNGRPERLRETVERSIKLLSVDEIDLLQLHSPDPNVPYEDSVGTLADMQREGWVRNIGVSNVSVEQLRVAQSIATIVSVQNRYNIADRDNHEAVVRACEAQNIAFLAYFPIAAGKLASGSSKVKALQEVGRDHNATTAQVSLAWLLQHSPVIVPIPGTSSVEHLRENVAAAELQLSPQDVEKLEN